MKSISLTWNNQLVFDKEFKNREERRTVNKVIGSLDTKIYRSLVFTVALFGFLTKKVSAGIDKGLEKTDLYGNQLLMIVQRVGFWVCVIGCLVEILVSVFKKGGGQKEIISLVFKWLLIFASFYLVPLLLSSVAEFFG